MFKGLTARRPYKSFGVKGLIKIKKLIEGWVNRSGLEEGGCILPLPRLEPKNSRPHNGHYNDRLIQDRTDSYKTHAEFCRMRYFYIYMLRSVKSICNSE
jgi:hypothetical protein